MIIRFLAALILFGSLLSLSSAEDLPINTDQNLSPELLENVSKAVQGFQSANGITETAEGCQAPLDMEEAVKNFQRPAEEAAKAAKSFQQPLPAKEYDFTAGEEKETFKAMTDYYKDMKPEGSCGRGQEEGTLYYFFSFSMPEETILNALQSALKINKECNQKVVLVIQGFVNNSLKETIAAYAKLSSQIKGDMPIELNPDLFKKFNVAEVPTVVMEKQGKTGVLRGDVGLSAIMERFGVALQDYGKYGNTYPVAEENFFDFVASKQPAIEQKLKGKMGEIQKAMFTLRNFDGRFEEAKEDRTYFIDPKLTLQGDVRDGQGRILYTAGTVFDPTAYARLGRYIVIDGNSKDQVEFALKGDYRKIMLISGDAGELMRKYKRRLYFVPEVLLEKFSIQRVPAIIEQEGNRVKITEKAL
jgi:conjugal transfer pilus assembly protein TraW